MAKQSFSVGQVLTAAQMTSLQQTAMGGGSPVTKTASYVLTAADAGTVIQVNSTSATTITVNTGLFAAGDSVQIQNINTGVVTITAGTATVTTSGSLALSQWEGGFLYFTSASASIFFDYTQTGAVSPLTTKGDIWGYSTLDARIPIGANDTVLTADSTQALGLKWATPSSGALTWTQRQTSLNATMYKVEYNGTNLYVAVGSSGTLYSSPDALTWTSRTSGFGANIINDVFFGNGLWVAVGNNGTITTSTDGTTWTARTANMGTSSIFAVTYANSLWVAVGGEGGTTNTGGITYSSDGLTWTRKSQSITVGLDYRTVVWNGTNWIVGADHSTNNYLYATTPSGTWTAGATGSANTVYKIIWDGTRHTTYESTAYDARYSTSLTLGTTTAMNSAHKGGGSKLGQMYYYNNKVYIINQLYFATYTTGSSANVTQSVPTYTPTSLNASTPFLNNNQGVVWAGAAGIIFAGVTGIYTSF
jgi:hypothetical protein